MARHRVDYRRVKVHRNYEVSEIADLLGVHKHTVRNWLRDGLAAIDGARPILVAGDDLRAFLKARRAAARRPLRHGELFCVACRDGKRPAGAMADYLPITSTSGNLAGFCPDCERMIYRRVRRDQLARVGGDLDITFPQGQPGIGGNLWPSSNADSEGERRPCTRKVRAWGRDALSPDASRSPSFLELDGRSSAATPPSGDALQTRSNKVADAGEPTKPPKGRER